MSLFDAIETLRREGARVPVIDIKAVSKSIHPQFKQRIESLTLTDVKGFDADTLEITLDDSDGQLILPERGQLLSLSFGWLGTPPVDKGSYTVDEIECSGAPDKMILRARSANMRAGLLQQREKSWHQVTLGQVTAEIATKYGLGLAIDPDLSPLEFEHLDQTNESDASFLTRITARVGAIATFKSGKIIVIRPGTAKSASGAPLPPVLITRSDGDGYHWRQASRDEFTGVLAFYHDLKTKKRGQFEYSPPETSTDQAGDAKNIKTLRHIYASLSNAKHGARAAFEKIQRGLTEFSITLAFANPELFPELPAKVSGFKKGVDGDYVIDKVTTSISESGFTTALDLTQK